MKQYKNKKCNISNEESLLAQNYSMNLRQKVLDMVKFIIEKGKIKVVRNFKTVLDKYIESSESSIQRECSTGRQRRLCRC